MKHAAGYVRVSTDMQMREGVSLAMQEARITQWADANGYRLTGIFRDEGISGMREDRKGLADALASLRKGGVLCVYSLARFGRSTSHGLRLADDMSKAGISLVSLSEDIDCTTPAGKLHFRMMFCLNEFERDQLAARTSAAMQFKRSKNELVGAVPYGKKLAEDGVKLLDEPGEQAIITLARELKNSGHSLRAVGRELAALGHFSRNGKPFTHKQIQRMLA